jgi:hypothetical protein
VQHSLLLCFAALGWSLVAVLPTKASPATQGPVATTPRVTPTAANTGAPDPNQTVCKREEVTGSRLPAPRECHTRAEWARIGATGSDKLQMLGAPGLSPTQQAAQAGNGP